MGLEEALIEDKRGTLIRVWAVPGSRNSSLEGIVEGHLRIRIRSRPEGGQANTELVKLMAGALSVSASSIEICKGNASRRKLLMVRGVTKPAAVAKLRAWMAVDTAT